MKLTMTILYRLSLIGLLTYGTMMATHLALSSLTTLTHLRSAERQTEREHEFLMFKSRLDHEWSVFVNEKKWQQYKLGRDHEHDRWLHTDKNDRLERLNR